MDMLMKTLEQAIAAFDEKTLSSAICVYDTLVGYGYTMEMLKARNKGIAKEQERLVLKGKKVVEDERRKAEEQWKEWTKIAPTCPDCGSPLNPPRHISKRKGPENIYGWTCHWFCSNEDCLYEKYTYEDARREFAHLMDKLPKNKL